MNTVRCGRILFALCLLLTCAVMWAAHTFYFVAQYLQHYEQTTFVRTSHDRLEMPSLLFCNKFPFTQAGLDRLGSAFNTPPVVEYLQNWLDSSYAASPARREQNTSSSQQAELTISSTLLGQAFKEHLDSLLISCIEVISGCSVQGGQLSSYECCSNHVQAYVSSLNGLCWIFNATGMNQRAYGTYQGIRLDFRISRHNFEPHVHPGIDVFLQPADFNALRMATELEATSGFRLKNKVGTSLLVTKRVSSRLDRSSDCGYTIGDAGQADRSNTNGEWVTCLVKAAIRTCKCVPLSVVLWVYRGDFNGQVISEQNATSICTVSEFDRCGRAYMDFARPTGWSGEIAGGRKQLADDVDECRKKHHRTCQKTEYAARQADFPLSFDPQTSGDFITSVAWGFESLESEDEVRTAKLSFFELATFAGWNLALWFAVGMLIWLLFVTSCCRSRVVANPTIAKVAPALSLVGSSGGHSPVSRPDSGQQPLVNPARNNTLPPIQSSRDSQGGLPSRLHLNS